MVLVGVRTEVVTVEVFMVLVGVRNDDASRRYEVVLVEIINVLSIRFLTIMILSNEVLINP